MVHNARDIAPWILNINQHDLSSPETRADCAELVKMLKSDPDAASYPVFPPILYKDLETIPENLFFSLILVTVSYYLLSLSLDVFLTDCRSSR